MVEEHLEFEHIVQVTDPLDPSVVDITRAQLWEGLVLRARCPQKFVEGIECVAHPPSGTGFVREISAGAMQFVEDVTLDTESRVHTKTQADKPQIYAESEACIEEPEPGFLCVRCRYRREMPEAAASVDVAEHLKAAYKQLDTDAISLIRIKATGAH